MAKANPFIVRGKTFYDSAFYNCILAANIAVYKYMADSLFSGDMERVVWSSIDKMFKRRQEQLTKRKVKSGEGVLGILDFPFCALRLSQDGIKAGSQRPWWNPALHVDGMWEEELGRRISITPATLTYEVCFCCSHDSDLYRITQNQIWDANAETLLTSYIDAKVEGKEPVTIKNIIVYSNDIRTNAKYAESDWTEKNKIQTVELTLTCQTWLVQDTPQVIKTPDREHLRWSITKKVLLDFAEGAGILGHTHGEGDVAAEAQRVVWEMFDGE